MLEYAVPPPQSWFHDAGGLAFNAPEFDGVVADAMTKGISLTLVNVTCPAGWTWQDIPHYANPHDPSKVQVQSKSLRNALRLANGHDTDL